MGKGNEGQTGFGLQTVRQVAHLLGAWFCVLPNLATLEFSMLKVGSPKVSYPPKIGQ